MNRLRVIIFQLVVSVAVFGQDYKSIAFNDSSFALKDSIEKEISFSETIAIINRFCSSDIQKLCLVAGWMYNNMNFDLARFIHQSDIFDKITLRYQTFSYFFAIIQI